MDHKPCVFTFGDFEVWEQEFLLIKSGKAVSIEPKAFRVLLFLLRNPGRLIKKDEILNAVWDDCSVSDNSLTRSIATLRRLLGDDARAQRYIETVPTVGYRFLGDCKAEQHPAGAPDPAGRGPALGLNSTLPHGLETIINKSLEKDRDLRYQSAAELRADLEKERRARQISVPTLQVSGRWKWFAATALLIALIVWALWRYPLRRAEVVERKLTANSAENSVTSMAVSPDGKYLAYADNTGIYLKLLRTGETHPVPLPPDFSARVDDWFPDGSRLLVTRAEQAGKASLWSISVFGGSPRQLADDASGGSLSPDGSHIAFRRGSLTYDGRWGREEWVMRSDGTDLVKCAAAKSDDSQVGAPTWSPDGKRIAYIRSIWAYNARTSSVEVNEWQKANAGDPLFR